MRRRQNAGMDKCHTCGHNYEEPMRISKGGKEYVFDSFECAVHALAPTCQHCDCRVLGHGVEEGGKTFCCAHCARMSGASQQSGRRAG